MFCWLRRKRKALVPFLTAAFLGSLFSFYCPHCLAKMTKEMAAMSIKHDTAVHCAHPGSNAPLPAGPHKHCNGFCDCAGKTMNFSAAHPVVAKDVQAWPGTRIAIRDDFYRPLPTVTYVTYIAGRPYKPDRACYPPLERICVLLN